MRHTADNIVNNNFFINRKLLKDLFCDFDFFETMNICSPLKDEETDYSHLHILHVDDNKIIGSILEEFFSLYGGKSQYCNSGKQALACLQNQHFDLIFMDKEMPELDGIETTKLIRSLSDIEKAQIPIIALTSDVSEDSLIEFRAAGANGFIAKPFSFVDINEMIHAVQKSLQIC